MVFSNQGTYPEFEDTILCNIIEKTNVGMFKQTWLTWQLYWGYSFWSGSIWIYPDPCLKNINFVKTTTYYLLGRQESTCTRIHLCRVVSNMKEAQDMFFFKSQFHDFREDWVWMIPNLNSVGIPWADHGVQLEVVFLRVDAIYFSVFSTQTRTVLATFTESIRLSDGSRTEGWDRGRSSEVNLCSPFLPHRSGWTPLQNKTYDLPKRKTLSQCPDTVGSPCHSSFMVWGAGRKDWWQGSGAICPGIFGQDCWGEGPPCRTLPGLGFPQDFGGPNTGWEPQKWCNLNRIRSQ